jgi:hypothetical protein
MYNGKGMKKYLQGSWFETLRERGYLGDKRHEYEDNVMCSWL